MYGSFVTARSASLPKTQAEIRNSTATPTPTKAEVYRPAENSNRHPSPPTTGTVTPIPFTAASEQHSLLSPPRDAWTRPERPWRDARSFPSSSSHPAHRSHQHGAGGPRPPSARRSRYRSHPSAPCPGRRHRSAAPLPHPAPGRGAHPLQGRTAPGGERRNRPVLLASRSRVTVLTPAAAPPPGPLHGQPPSGHHPPSGRQPRDQPGAR